MILERRQIHIHLTNDVHIELKKLCAEERVTMQEVIEHYINGLVDENEEMTKIFKELIRLKRSRKINRISKVEKEEIFNQILGDAKDEIP